MHGATIKKINEWFVHLLMDVEGLRDWVQHRIKGIDFWQQISLMNVYSCRRGDRAMQLFINTRIAV